ncbi:hypothetical protein [Streptomyces sp. MK5]|uniref:hypothetical protein n=1 Tax=Streptomyces sp. MK5 TaxID=3064253 RepID=UPI002742978F|nr:hypothetical protein [Streptomyces sp. MK5]
MVIKQLRALLLHRAARHGLAAADCSPGGPHRSCVTGPSPHERGSGRLGDAPAVGELGHVDAFALKVIEDKAADDGEVGRLCPLQAGAAGLR